LEHLVIVCAVLAGLAEVPWQATALAGAACQDLGAFEASPEPWSWRVTIGMALIGAGQSLLAWSIGMGARLLAGS
jgi:hypothetical protein